MVFVNVHRWAKPMELASFKNLASAVVMKEGIDERSPTTLPGDVIPEGVDRSLVPTFFELQVKTLFQHAWSEANHDLGYKSSKALTDDQIRRLAYTSAQAWGADRVFEELWSELRANEIGTPQLKTS